MDVLTSRKITRNQGTGLVQVVMSNVSDLYPIFADGNELVIADIEMLDDPRKELLDRSMWAILKQRGADPLDIGDGNQIEECIMGEISAVALIGQIAASVVAEGPGVQSSFGTTRSGGKEYLTIAITLTPAA
jgi:hypothetical protein